MRHNETGGGQEQKPPFGGIEGPLAEKLRELSARAQADVVDILNAGGLDDKSVSWVQNPRLAESIDKLVGEYLREIDAHKKRELGKKIVRMIDTA